jgi:nucleoside-diphosphate-sugar epimerase
VVFLNAISMLNLSKRILITGASGYIGSHLVAKLESLEASSLYCITSSSQSKKDTKAVKWLRADITKKQEISELVQEIQPHYIIHLAASGTKHSQTVSSLSQMMEVNAFGTQYLIDAAIESDNCEGFLNITSAYEYGPSGEPIHEDTIFHPQGDYAISKFVGSIYLEKQVRDRGFPGVNYRLFSVYGPKDS